MECGEQCAVTDGAWQMQQWYAGSLVIPVQVNRSNAHMGIRAQKSLTIIIIGNS